MKNLNDHRSTEAIIRLMIIFTGVVFLCFPVPAQDIEQIPEKEPLKFSGSLSLRLNAYASSRDNTYRDPFMWTIAGSPTVSVYGITFPFSFSVSNKNTDFRQPFNQFGMSPHYKWLTVHAGYRNITFSNYTLGGHTILGGGFEATPSIFRIGFMYGRFRKANELSVNRQGNFLAPYKRTGFAAKIGVGNSTNYVDLILLKAKDDSTSVNTTVENLSLQPSENMVVGLKAHQRFFDAITLNVDYGFSIYTRNMGSGLLNAEKYNVPGILTGLYDVRQSTQFNMAGRGSLSFRIKSVRLRLQYLRIEPDFKSMGTYFINNDRENITVAPSFNLFRNKLRINGSVGLQRNNLFKDKMNRTNRWISSVNVSYVPSSKVNLNVNYSNYQINQERIIQPIDTSERRDRLDRTLDSLRLQQYSHNVNSNFSLNLGSGEQRHTINLNMNYQIFGNANQTYERDMFSRNFSPNLSYSYRNDPASYGLRFNVNMNSFKTSSNSNFRYGLTAGGNKSFLDETFRSNLSLTYYSNYQDSEATSNTYSVRGRLGYRVAEQHNLSLNLNFMSRNAKSDLDTSYSEILATIGYSYSL